MATYGQHTCLYMDSDVTIERWQGDWYYTVYVPKARDDDDPEKYETQIKFCPFCGQELDK